MGLGDKLGEDREGTANDDNSQFTLIIVYMYNLTAGKVSTGYILL